MGRIAYIFARIIAQAVQCLKDCIRAVLEGTDINQDTVPDGVVRFRETVQQSLQSLG